MTGNPPPQKLLKFDKALLFNFFFFGILIFLLYQLLRVLSPFLGSIIVASTFALIFFPVNTWLRKKVFANRTAAAGASTLTALLTLVLPLLVFGWLLLKESRELYPKTNQWLTTISQREFDIRLPDRVKSYVDLEPGEILTGNIKVLQEKITRSGAGLLKNIFFFLINFGVMVVTLFMLFRDGERFLTWLIDIIPMDQEYKHRVANQLYTTTMAVVRGLLLTAMIQGFIGALGYWLAGVKSPALFGMLTSFAALIPFVGTSLVWLPLAIGMYFLEGARAGLFVLLWGAVAVGLTDNLIRPVLIGKGAKLPIFLLFLGIFGGLQVYGPIGLFLGPLLISCIIVFLQIYREHKNLPLPPQP
ncbi:MAG: AI-2E family transporter [Elusimicrobiales bacterium]|nr:AI-2E family transporter [Elusimicrobiales bacterium]